MALRKAKNFLNPKDELEREELELKKRHCYCWLSVVEDSGPGVPAGLIRYLLRLKG